MGWEGNFIVSKKPVITVVGAGGKTTVIKHLARSLRLQNKKTLVTTTTHIMAEKNHCQSDEQAILRELQEYGMCFAGVPDGEKLTALPICTLEKIMAAADAVLIEGDGSRRMPIKFPASYEPVIIPQTTDIIIVAGMSAVGKKLGDVCHRRELTGLDADTIVTPKLMAWLINTAYAKTLGEQFPNAHVWRLLNQADTPKLRDMAHTVEEFAGECIITSFEEGERNDI